MKKIFTIMTAVLITASVFLPQQARTQAPDKMSYQAVVRDASDNLVANQSVGMQISILQGSATGTAVYTETHTPTTNANGLVTIEIGTGTTSDDFTTIDWANGPYFIKIETDPTGGTSYSISGTSQLLSVPYAMHAKTAENVTGGINETDPVYSAWNKSDDISIINSQVSDFQAGVSSNTDVVANTAKVTFPEAPNDGNEYVRKNEVWSVVTQSGVSDHTLLSNIGTNTHAQIDTHLSDGTVHFIQAGISITENQISDFGNYESAFSKNTAFNKNYGNSAGTVTEGNDSRLSDARTPTSHATGHTDGSDNIQDATSSQKGLMTATYATKLEGIENGAEVNVNADWSASSGDAQILNKPSDLTDLSGHNVTELADISDAGSGIIISSAERTKLSGIETGADITDATNVDAAGAVMESDFNAGTFLYATSDNTPQPKTVSETKAILSMENVENTALSTWAGSGNITSLGTVTSGTLSTGAALADVTMSLGSDADGDIYYRSGGKLTRLPKGTDNQVLTLEIGVPAWKDAASGSTTYTVGLNLALGGYVIEVGPDGKHGLVVALQDQSSGVIWYESNDVCSNAANHTTSGSNFKDWRLPTRRELNLMYTQKSAINAAATANGGVAFATNVYWSSTENGFNSAWLQGFSSGNQNNVSKSLTYFLRSVRAF